MKKMSCLILTSLSLLLVSPTLAHSIWLEKEEEEELTIKYGHVEKEFEGYDPNKVKTVTAFAQSGDQMSVEMIPQGEKMILETEASPSLVAVTFDNGYWVETADGWQNISKQEVDSYISSSHTYKYTKALYQWSSSFIQPVDLTLEIVPLNNPFTLSSGEELKLKVLYEKEPLSQVKLTYNGAEGNVIETDKNGIASISLSDSKLHYIEVNHRYSVENNPKADEIAHSSTLTFELD
jgi:ABC-type Co2+ transport system, periplasmic component